MQKVAQVLPYVSRSLAIFAVLAGLVPGLFEATFAADFVCFDSCPDRDFYFSYLPRSLLLMTPCVVLAVLAMAVFVAYCLVTRQTRRAVLVLLVLLVGGLAGVAALYALLQHAQATLPSYSVSDGGTLLPDQLRAWQVEWGGAFILVAGVWSGVLAYLQWRR